ncbi:TPA: recombinase RecA [Candidatus Acetothermia bacterium]|nr:recombinase RecA [Candidatus Acetothermia bacterium]
MGEDKRVCTGIPGLDEALLGGFLPGRTYLVVGSPGTGKTILSVQWLRAGAARGERSLYITLAEPISELKRNLAGLGWDLRGIDLVDLSPQSRPEEAHFQEYRVFPPSEVEESAFWQGIWEAVEEHKPERLVLDPVTLLKDLSPDLYQFRRNLLRLVGFLNGRRITTVLVAEPGDVEEERTLALVGDGVIRLTRTVGPSRLTELRAVAVEKMRGSGYLPGLHPLRITSEGIVVFPHHVFPPSAQLPSKEGLGFGIPGLDELLDGGVGMGTATVIAGPAGVGKSTLGTRFMAEAARKGLPGVIYTFEEPPATVIARGQALGILDRDLLGSGRLKVMSISPLTLYPDEFLQLVRHEVEEEGRKAVMIDSLRGYSLAMEEYGSLVTHTHNLAAYLGGRGVTALWIAETERITGELSLTELGVSFVFDNALLLRYVEEKGQVIRAIGCLKKRTGKSSSEIRRLQITPQGLRVGGEPLHVPGFFTGIAPARETG